VNKNPDWNSWFRFMNSSGKEAQITENWFSVSTSEKTSKTMIRSLITLKNGKTRLRHS
jgi:hypothetical protein